MIARWPAVTAGALALMAFAAATCTDDGPVGTSSGGTGGAGGCPSAPEPLFTLLLHAADGPLPSDTRLRVRWSAGEEPDFVLSDKSTWRSLDEGANVVCNVDPTVDDPDEERASLSCELWTSGATHVVVSALGYVTHDETLQPKVIEDCEAPVPSDVDVELPRDHDAGPPR